MILRSILNQENGLGGLGQYPPEKGDVGSRVEAAFLPLIKEVACKVLNQPEDFIAFALAAGLDLGLLAAPRPRVRERAPLRERRFIAKEQQGLALFGPAQYLWPRRGAPRLPFGFIKMIRDEGSFLKAKAQVLQQLGDVEDVVEDAEAVVNQLLDHGRTPAGTAEPRLDRPCVNEGGESDFLRRGEFGRAPGRLPARCTLAAIATEQAYPSGDGLLVHAQDPGDLRKTLAVEHREDREEIFDLAEVPQVLGCLQLAFHFFTIRGRHGKTHAAHRDVPPPMRLAPRWQECPRCVASRQSIFRKSFS